MAGFVLEESSNHEAADNGPQGNSADSPEEFGGRWYFSRKEIEESPPSRRDGIDLKKETYLRKSYCTFLQDLGMRLKVPQVTIATAIIFCHRFFVRQSHAKNDRRTIATVCMFLAGKVEETPRPLKDVILVSYDIINKKDPTAAQRIKQKEVYEQQKELILLAERVVLATLGFDFNVHHPYKPLVEAIKKFKVAQNALAQVAWNFVNDGLRTSLCLQFKPHHIAAGAIFLAAKFLKVKLPSDGEKVWWQEIDVTPRQLEEVSNQMLELYEQNRAPATQGNEVESSVGGGPNHRGSAKVSSENDEQVSRQTSSRPPPEHLHSDNHSMPPRSTQNQISNSGSAEMDGVISNHKVDIQVKDNHHLEHSPENEDVSEVPNMANKHQTDRVGGEDRKRNGGRNENTEAGEWKDVGTVLKSGSIAGRNMELQEGPVGQSPREAIKIDKDKVKAALEKRRKSRVEMTRKKEVVDEDDLIERELEDGIELAVVDDKRRERRQSWGKSGDPDHDENQHGTKGTSDNAEEGEMLDDSSPMLNSSRKRKCGSGSSLDRQPEGKRRHDAVEDGHRGRIGHAERDGRRHAQENHL